MLFAFAEGDVAVDLAVIEILRDAGLARGVGEDDVFVPAGAVLIVEVADHVGADQIGAVDDRNLDDAADIWFNIHKYWSQDRK